MALAINCTSDVELPVAATTLLFPKFVEKYIKQIAKIIVIKIYNIVFKASSYYLLDNL